MNWSLDTVLQRSCAVTTGPSSRPSPLPDWCRFNNTSTTFIDPGFALAERTHRIIQLTAARRSSSNGQLFESLLEAQVLLEDWRQQYNRERLHSSLCYLTAS